ncbi:MAG: hypothetical protein HQ558_04870 [Candidatus Omnitrophica bacterium]|nr:hypothetical protein [Candidatus Omnitrophota bacterium]
MKKITTKKPKARRSWCINPKTRVKESARVYKRPKAKQHIKNQVREEAR